MHSLRSFDELFSVVCEYLRGKVSEINYTLWVKDIIPVGMEGKSVRLRVTNKFKKNIVEEKYIPLLLQTFEEVLGFPVDISVECDEEISSSNVIRLSNELFESTPSGDYEFTFDTFIVGSSNKFAYAASIAVASNPGGAYNPLFIYGASGLGKTHLLNAIKNEITKTLPNKNLLLVKGDNFTNELIQHIQSGSTARFHEKYRTADALLMDDVQFIGGKESTMEEFFHTFNTLYQDGKQIILTSDRPPKEIKTLEDRLRTRFEWGLLADVQIPDFETRIAIIRRKAELLQIEMPDDVAEYIANRIKNNIRQLEGTVKRIKAYKLIQGIPPSIISAQSSIKDILNDSQPVPVTIEKIISEVGRMYNVSAAEIKSNKRNSNISNARQVSMYIVREITQISMSLVGEEFGGRDHSTVVYAMQQVEKNMKKDPRFKEMISDILNNIRNA